MTRKGGGLPRTPIKRLYVFLAIFPWSVIGVVAAKYVPANVISIAPQNPIPSSSLTETASIVALPHILSSNQATRAAIGLLNEQSNPENAPNYAIPLLKRACSCESWGDPNKQPREFYPDGRLVIGYPNPADIGACQINTTIWGATAQKLGYDIYTFQGNIAMANYIYSVQGMDAWKWSESCWSQ